MVYKFFSCSTNIPRGLSAYKPQKLVVYCLNKCYTQCVRYITPLLPQFSFLRFSVQLERRCSPPRNAFPNSRLVLPRGTRNFLAITYLDNFRKTCHFQVAWTPAILFCVILVFPLTMQYNRGELLASVTNCVRPLYRKSHDLEYNS